MCLCPPILTNMIMTVVRVLVCVLIKFFSIGYDCPTLTTGDGFHIVKGKTAQIPNAPQRFTIIGAANSLTGIFK